MFVVVCYTGALFKAIVDAGGRSIETECRAIGTLTPIERHILRCLPSIRSLKMCACWLQPSSKVIDV